MWFRLESFKTMKCNTFLSLHYLMVMCMHPNSFSSYINYVCICICTCMYTHTCMHHIRIECRWTINNQRISQCLSMYSAYTYSHIRTYVRMYIYTNTHFIQMYFYTYVRTYVHTIYPEILAVIKFGDLPEIWSK